MNMNWQDYKIAETLVYYDRPLLCTVRDKDGWLGLTVLAQDDDQGEEWLLVPFAEAEYVALRSGQLDLRDAFLNRPAYAVYQSFTGSVSMRQLESVPDDWLPYAGVKFNLPATPSPDTPGTPATTLAG